MTAVPELLAELFSSRVRAAVLALVLPRPHLSFSLTELSRRLELPISSLQHECYKLARLGLLHDQRVGNARRYRPNPAFTLLEPLTALILRALPLEESLRGAAEGVPGLQRAWIAGPLAESAAPLYLVVVGQLDLEAIDALFDRVRAALASAAPGPLELAYFLPGDWQARQEDGDMFAAALLSEVRTEVATGTVNSESH
jgi:hypothetical protein